MNTKTQHYLIECTFDTNGKQWEPFDEKLYKSYVTAKEETWKLTQKEAEYNRSEAAQEFKIYGFRIVRRFVETKTEVITEFLI